VDPRRFATVKEDSRHARIPRAGCLHRGNELSEQDNRGCQHQHGWLHRAGALRADRRSAGAIDELADFERIYGGIDALEFADDGEVVNYLAHGVRTFFDNGGKRLYASRIYAASSQRAQGFFAAPAGHAWADILPTNSPLPDAEVRLIARYPGTGGNIQVKFTVRVGQDVLTVDPLAPADPSKRLLRGVQPYDLVAVNYTEPTAGDPAPIRHVTLYRAQRPTGAIAWQFYDDADVRVSALDTDVTIKSVRVVSVSVEVSFPPPFPRPGAVRTEVWENLGFDSKHARALDKYFGETLATRAQALTVPFYIRSSTGTAANLPLGPIGMARLFGSQPLTAGPGGSMEFVTTLSQGQDGNRPAVNSYTGDDADPLHKTGLKSFEDLADISIIAAPGSSYDSPHANAVSLELVKHAELMRYRIAVLDAPEEQAISEIRAYRAQFDSAWAALYYPWVTIVDPVSNDELSLPPSGFVAGIYARNDVDKGVHKAPANEVVADAIGFEVSPQQSAAGCTEP